MLKFKAGDKVKITSGKDKGTEGTIEKIFPKVASALIPNVNLYKKHVKPTQGNKGGIFDIPRPLLFSKLALVCSKCKKPTRVGFKMVGKEKARICKRCNRELDASTKKKAK